MTTRSLTVGDEFRRLREEFASLGHHAPGLFHCWLRSQGDLRTQAMEHVVFELSGLSVVAATRWPDPQTRIVDTSCFFGDSRLFDGFQRLAMRARRNLVALLEAARRRASHSSYEPLEAWMADLHHLHDKNSRSPISVRTYHVCQWPGTRLGPFQEIISDENENLYNKLIQKHGDPSFCFQLSRLPQDVVTTSIATIDEILGAEDAQESLAASAPFVVDEGAPSDREVISSSAVLTSPTDSPLINSTSKEPARPDWVNAAEMIGPCPHTAFAKLMGVSDSTLYRQIRSGKVWKGQGPTTKRFFFAHRDRQQHAMLRHAYEHGPKKHG